MNAQAPISITGEQREYVTLDGCEVEVMPRWVRQQEAEDRARQAEIERLRNDPEARAQLDDALCALERATDAFRKACEAHPIAAGEFTARAQDDGYAVLQTAGDASVKAASAKVRIQFKEAF